MTLQWITMNPHTKEGLVLSPPMPLVGTEFLYLQILEWAALRHLMIEVKESGGGDMNLNTIYIKACEMYCDKWAEDEINENLERLKDATLQKGKIDHNIRIGRPAEPEPPQETPT